MTSRCAFILVAIAGTAQAQSLFHAPAPAPAPAPAAPAPGSPTDQSHPASGASTPATVAAAPAPAAGPTLASMSLYAIQPAEPRVFQENDLITILVNESSKMQRDGKLDTKREYDMTAPQIDIPDLIEFFAFGGSQESVNPLNTIKPSFEVETKSKGAYQRSDRIDARITARVLEVKPNGQLVLEAKSEIGTDDELQTFLLSGVCRQEDITDRNTVLSSQLFGLRIDVKNEGEIRQATKKGLFPIILETLFNF